MPISHPGRGLVEVDHAIHFEADATAMKAIDGVPSHDDWDRIWAHHSASAELNPAQEYRRRLILRLLQADRAARVVDIGSGQGDLARDLAASRPNIEILGLELSLSGIIIAESKCPTARFLQANLLDVQAPGQYEAWGTHAVCSEVLEHVDDPATLLRNAACYLAPGARIVITVPGGPRTAFDLSIGHRPHFDRKRIATVIRAAGLEVLDVRAAGFPFFNLYRLVVLARGKRLISDVRQQGASAASATASVVLRFFTGLFRWNVDDTPFGWQIVAVARVPTGASNPLSQGAPS